jgi:hypothetical protein
MASFLMAMAASGMAGAQPAPAPAPAMAQPAAPFVEAEARAAVEALATALDDNFVFPEIGDRYAAALRAKLASGGYARFESADAFAKASRPTFRRSMRTATCGCSRRSRRKAGEAPRRMGPQPDTAIGKSGWLADGVAYIDFRGFPGDPATLQRLRTFLDGHATASDADHRRASPWRRRAGRDGRDVPALLRERAGAGPDGHALRRGGAAWQPDPRRADPGARAGPEGDRPPLPQGHPGRPGERPAQRQDLSS